jgi:hypothetical protein
MIPIDSDGSIGAKQTSTHEGNVDAAVRIEPFGPYYRDQLKEK